MHPKSFWRLKTRHSPGLKGILLIFLVWVLPACNAKPTQPTLGIPTANAKLEISNTATIAVINNALSDDQAANLTLVEFFDHLNAGRYEEAAGLYAGTYQTMIDQNPSIDSQEHAALLRNACTINGFQCLQIKIAGIDRKPSPTEFIFTVQFKNKDDSLFMLVTETEQTTTPRSFFDIRVTKTSQGEFRVMDMPPYMP